MYTLNIYHDKKIVKSFTNQENDFKAFEYLLRSQSHSTDWAIKYEGWRVEIINETTGEKSYYNNIKP